MVPLGQTATTKQQDYLTSNSNPHQKSNITLINRNKKLSSTIYLAFDCHKN
uniref:Uncharacterized protein n=1 Tax=Musa acuminata subsp. malaccensis TaxID=214687 RepID=A0A804KIU1_MUSAM